MCQVTSAKPLSSARGSCSTREATSKVKDSSNKSYVHSAKIASFELYDGWILHTATFKLEYTDPEAKKDREEKAAKEAKKKQEADAKAAAEAERKAQESVVINAEN